MRGALSFLLAAVVVVAHAAAEPGALAPSLESYLETGSRSEAELTAVAEAFLAKSGALSDASADTYSDTESESEAEAEAAAALGLDSEMPRDTQQQSAELSAERRRETEALKRAAALPNPPPKPNANAPNSANPASAAASVVATALSADNDRDDVIKLVYDELKRLGTSPVPELVAGASPSASGIADPRVQSLERRLTGFEKKRVEETNRVQDKAIGGLNDRLMRLDKTLTALKRSAEQQQKLTNQLLDAAAISRGARGVDTTPDQSVVYERAELPADFDERVRDILGSVKREARKIYERYCRRKKKKRPTPSLGTGTPKTYPKENTPPPKGLHKPKAPAPLPKQLSKPLPKPTQKRRSKPGKPAAAAAKPAMPTAAATVAAADARTKEISAAKRPRVWKPKKILFSPITVGKEPVPTALRLSKTLNDISRGLPVTPAYHLGAKEQALQDVLGEQAVSNRWKSPRP